MSTTTVNVAIAGASSDLGRVILSKMLASEHFKVSVLKRAGASSTYPAEAHIVEVDYDSPESVQAALRGQDAVVSTLGITALGAQQALIDAAAAAGVKRFIPSEFGSDLDNPKTRALPVFGQKVPAQEYLKQKCATSGLSYTLVYNAAFLDWGLSKNFLVDLAHYKPMIIDGGDVPFSTTTLVSIGDAVVGILTHLEETKNRSVRIHDVVTTQNKLLELAKKAGPAKPWAPIPVKLDDLTKRADERLAQGLYDMETFAPYLYRALMDPAYGSNFSGKTDNELLGVKGITNEGILEIMKGLLG